MMAIRHAIRRHERRSSPLGTALRMAREWGLYLILSAALAAAILFVAAVVLGTLIEMLTGMALSGHMSGGGTR